MRWSKYFIPTLKETPVGTEAVSHQLLLRAGLVHMLTSGVYSYLPLGLAVLKNIEDIIRQEMNQAGAVEVFLPCLHPLEVWKKTGRDKTMDEVMIKFKDNRGREMCLGPTHEEIITDLVSNFVKSYKQLPVTLYQIQTKFRDELRTRFGIVRACEFIMKDAYSFDRDWEQMKVNYNKMYEAYKNIFKRIGLEVLIVEADSGAMGGDVSHEFMVPAPIGEDEVLLCGSCGHVNPVSQEPQPKCVKCSGADLKKTTVIELGHIFQLGTKYSEALQAMVLTEEGKTEPIIMGCYGIGVSRVIAAVIEKNNDEKGIIWPKSIAPFQVEIIPLHRSDDDTEILQTAQEIYDTLKADGYTVLLDDRQESPGRKFNDADLIGMPVQLIIGQKNLKDGNVEIKSRKTRQSQIIKKTDAVSQIISILEEND
ncbi:MAG: proline--tRNA ligase [Candidatus Omnitrophica bacterium]|nr:proline--tRNA ligase [Candidatus Omnitrophota bacterium]